MKKQFHFFLLFSITALASSAQTIAADWIKSDCSINNHTLYSYLDNEEVVIMEFAMGCGSCTNAATYLLNTKDKYAISNPGKVHVFYMDYWPGNDCAVEIAAATTGYAFDGVFDHCLPEKDFYFTSTSSPMPGIVIAAGSFHQVIYQNNSFTDDDTILIEQAITTFFANVGITENSINTTLQVFPNPTSEEIVINFNNTEISETKISLYNVNGQLISLLLSESLQVGEVQKRIDIRALPKGIYYVNIVNSQESINKKIIII